MEYRPPPPPHCFENIPPQDGWSVAYRAEKDWPVGDPCRIPEGFSLGGCGYEVSLRCFPALFTIDGQERVFRAQFSRYNPAPAPTPGPTPEPEPEGYYVIGLNGEPAGGDPVGIARLKQEALAHANGLGITPDYLYGAAFTGYAGFLTSAQVAAAKADEANVLSVEQYVEEFFFPEDNVGIVGAPRPATQPQVVPAAVARVGGSATGSRPPVDADIAVLDTGVDLDHPDLDVVGGVDCTRRDGEGFDDDEGHGTRVAGLAAARDNGGDIVGTAPGARLWSVKISYFTGKTTYASWLCGMDWVVEHAAVIDSANNSSSAQGYDEDVENSGDCDVADHTNGNTLMSCAVEAAGVPFVVGAGNDAIALSRGRDVLPYGGFSQYVTVSGLADYDGAPGGRAAATCPGGAGDADDSFDDHSNYGPEVDLVAPSVCVLTTQAGGGTVTDSGTSLSAPLVAGAIAVYRAQHPGATPDQVVEHLRASGSVDWDAADDPDGVKEPLLRVPGPDAPAPTGPAGTVPAPRLSERYAELVPTQPREPVSAIG